MPKLSKRWRWIWLRAGIACGVFYSICAFAEADANMAHWDGFTAGVRVAFAVAMLVIVLTTWGIAVTEYNL